MNMDVDLNIIKKKILKHYFHLMKDDHFKEMKSIQVEDSSKVAVCFYANKKYIEGLTTAIYSLRKNSKNIPTVILFSDEIEEIPAGVDKLIKIDTDDFRHIELFPYLLPDGLKWDQSIFYKLSIFNVQGYDRIVYVDSDMLILKDIGDLWDMDKYNECDFYSTWSEPHLLVSPIDSYKNHYSSAITIINKNLLNVDVYKSLIKMSVLHKSYEGSDQGVINYYMRKKSVCCGMLNQSYNVYTFRNPPYEYKEHEKPEKVLHFIAGPRKFKSWIHRISQGHFKKEYVDLYNEYFNEAKKEME
jgi:lipopolysaccharide biosynthesis glycosyltransferase